MGRGEAVSIREEKKMHSTPRRMPILMASLLMAGMAIFLIKIFFPVPVEKVLVAFGALVFFAGMVVALVAMIWSIRTLTSESQRRGRGVTTPVVTILLAVFVWAGAGLTLYKYKKSHDVRVEARTHPAPNTATETK